MRVLRSEVQLFSEDGHAAVGASFELRPAMVFPDHPAGAAIEGDHAVGVGHIHDAVDYDRHALEFLGAREMIDPFRRQRGYVAGVDLFQRAVPLRVVGSRIREPVVRVGFEQVLIGDLSRRDSHANKEEYGNRLLTRAAHFGSFRRLRNASRSCISDGRSFWP